MYHYVKVEVPGVGPCMTLGTLFEQIEIPLPNGYFLRNINTFRPVVHENKIFEDLSKFSLLGPKRAPLFEQIWFPKHVSYQVWLKLA